MNTSPIDLITFIQYLQTNTIATLLLVPLALILLDLITGVISAVKNKTFAWNRLTAYCGNDGLYYSVIILLVTVSYFTIDVQEAATIAASLGMGTLSLSIFTSILSNLHEIYPPLAELAAQVGALIGLSSQKTVEEELAPAHEPEPEPAVVTPVSLPVNEQSQPVAPVSLAVNEQSQPQAEQQS